MLLWLLAVLALAWFCTSPFYWRRRGLHDYLLPVPIFGSFLPTLYLSTKEFFDKLYNSQFRAPYSGIHLFTRPALFLRHPDIIAEVLEEKSAYFGSHGVYTNIKTDPIGRSVFHLDGNEWKNVRAKISPQFSPTKVKSALDIGRPSIDKLVEDISNSLDDVDGKHQGTEIEIQHRAMFLTIDTTAATLFGVDSGVFKDKRKSEFYIASKEMNPPSSMFKVLLGMLSPRLYDLLRVTSFIDSVNQFLNSVIETSLNLRKSNQDGTKILADKLVELVENDADFDKGLMISQGFVLWTGGVETTALTLSFALYELAVHQDLQEEIRASLGTEKGTNLINRVIQETLRKYPIFGMMTRQCTSRCMLSTGFVVEPGDLLIIPALSVHYNPDFYPDPQEFRIDREYPRGAYIPFGAGPRTCLGMKLSKGILEETLTRLLKEFEFRPGKSPMVLENTSFFTSPKGGNNYLNVRKTTKKTANSIEHNI